MTSWKDWVPYYGDYKVKKKIQTLDRAGIGVPMVIILMLQKSFELMVKRFGQDLPIPQYATFLLVAATVFTLYVYDKQIREKAEETVKETQKQD